MVITHYILFLKGMIKDMITNEIINLIMSKYRISNVLLSKITGIHVTTISRYRNNQRNIGKKSFNKIYNAFIELDVGNKNIKELKQKYENSRNKKIL